MSDWSIDLSEYAEKKNVEIKEVRKAFVFALYSSVVKKTPVHRQHGGRARANWNISVGSPDSSVTDSTRVSVTEQNVPDPEERNSDP